MDDGPLRRHEVWQHARRVLAVRLDNLGDLLMTTPALAALRESLPQAHLTLLTTPSVASAVAGSLPMVDAAWGCAMPWTAQGAAQRDAAAPLGEAERALVARLAQAEFDAAVIFTVSTQSALPAALACRMAGIPLRLAHCRENPYGLLTDWVPESDEIGPGMRHEVQRQLALVRAVGCTTADERLRFAVSAADRDALARRLRSSGIAAGRPYVVLHPGATAASRRWPPARFGQVAAELVRRTGVAVVFAGDASDLPRVVAALREVALAGQRPAAPVISLAGELRLGELAALIDGAQALVANNSAPMHLAAALGTPVAALYALTNPQHTPWRVAARVLSHDVPCRWCLKSVCPQQHHRCLRGVEPPRVLEALLQLLPSGTPRREAEALALEDRP